MAVSYAKYKKQEWKENPVLAQVKEMQREVEKLKAVLSAIEGKVPVVTVMRAGAQATNTPNVSSAAMAMELDTLKGWIDSLVESEIGLHALTMPDMRWATLFAMRRKNFMDEQVLKWTAILTLQSAALRELARSLFGPTNPFSSSLLANALPGLKALLDKR
jgi:hypothetical protein